jgi:hypothetical protein
VVAEKALSFRASLIRLAKVYADSFVILVICEICEYWIQLSAESYISTGLKCNLFRLSTISSFTYLTQYQCGFQPFFIESYIPANAKKGLNSTYRKNMRTT